MRRAALTLAALLATLVLSACRGAPVDDKATPLPITPESSPLVGADCGSPPGWTRINRPTPANPVFLPAPAPPHEILTSIAPSRQARGRLFAGGMSGFYVSDDCGHAWHGQNVPLRVHAVVVRADGQDRLFMSNGRDPLRVSHDGGRTWAAAKGVLPDGRTVPRLFANVMAVSAGPSAIAYANSFRNSDAAHGLFPLADWRTDDGGNTWRPLTDRWTPAPIGGGWSPNPRILAADRHDPDVVIARDTSHGIQTSSDGGATFVPHPFFAEPLRFAATAVTQLRIGPDGSRIWTLTADGHLYRRDGLHAMWRQIEPPAEDSALISFELNPHDAQSVFAIMRDHSVWLYREPSTEDGLPATQ